LFSFQGEQILAQPLIIVMLAMPILIHVYFNSGLVTGSIATSVKHIALPRHRF
jgi:ACR3 family arsenite efflux pump ArsB